MVERRLPQPDRDGGDAEAAGVESSEGDLEPVPLVAEQPFGRHAYVVEPHRRGGRTGEPIFRSGGSALRPSVSAGTRKQEIPLRSSEVRAITL